MPVPPFLARLRERIGHEPVLLPGVSAVVRDDDGRILCLLRSDTHQWSLPSGICEPGEEPAQTIVRELMEEAGIVVRPERVLAVYGDTRVEYPNGDVADYVSIMFECRWLEGTPEPRDGEALEVRFFPPDALPSIPRLERLGLDLHEFTDAPAVFRWSDDWLPAEADTAREREVEAGTVADAGDEAASDPG